MFKGHNKDTRTTPGVLLVSSLLTLNIFKPCSRVPFVNFEQINAGWGAIKSTYVFSSSIQLKYSLQDC